MSESRFRPDCAPDGEGEDRHADDGRHEPGGDDVCQALNRGTAALRFADHPYDLRQQRVGAHAFGPHQKRSRAVDRAAGDAAAGLFFRRNGLAGDHRFVDRASSFDDDAVHRDLLAGTHATHIPDLHTRDRHVHFLVASHEARGSRRQSQKLFDGRTRAAARAQFEHLPKQHEHRDRGRGVEIRRHDPVLPESLWKESGRECAERAVDI